MLNIENKLARIRARQIEPNTATMALLMDINKDLYDICTWLNQLYNRQDAVLDKCPDPARQARMDQAGITDVIHNESGADIEASVKGFIPLARREGK